MTKYGGVFDVDDRLKENGVLEKEMNDPNFWNNDSSSKVLEKLKNNNEVIKPMQDLKKKIDDLNSYYDLLQENNDEEIEKEFEDSYNQVLRLIEEKDILAYLNEPYDKNNAIFEIHAGAGGTESCDWALMLSRMYTKYFSSKGFKYEVISEQKGEETGIKSITYMVSGNFCYGYLKSEKGVHRLVRLSPFDSNNRRHTSFAAVDVIPEFNDDINIEIKENDIRVDVYRSSGAGGQGVNTTDSAVRITYIPMNIVVTCQNERSQLKNKETAMKVLKSKIYQIKLQEKQEKIGNMKSSNSDIEFGSQIRSYVLHPYSMIKDHRTNFETSNVNKVLEGNIDEFIDSYLRREEG